jgi:hypothetical protein
MIGSISGAAYDFIAFNLLNTEITGCSHLCSLCFV